MRESTQGTPAQTSITTLSWDELVEQLPSTAVFKFTITSHQGTVTSVLVECRGESRQHASCVDLAQDMLKRVFGDHAPDGEYKIIYTNGAVSSELPSLARRERTDIKRAAKVALLLPALTQYAHAYAQLPRTPLLRHVARQILILMCENRPSDLVCRTLSLDEALRASAQGGWSHWYHSGSIYKTWVLYCKGEIVLSMLPARHQWTGEIHQILLEHMMTAFRIEQQAGV